MESREYFTLIWKMMRKLEGGNIDNNSDDVEGVG